MHEPRTPCWPVSYVSDRPQQAFCRRERFVSSLNRKRVCVASLRGVVIVRRWTDAWERRV